MYVCKSAPCSPPPLSCCVKCLGIFRKGLYTYSPWWCIKKIWAKHKHFYWMLWGEYQQFQYWFLRMLYKEEVNNGPAQQLPSIDYREIVIQLNNVNFLASRESKTNWQMFEKHSCDSYYDILLKYILNWLTHFSNAMQHWFSDISFRVQKMFLTYIGLTMYCDINRWFPPLFLLVGTDNQSSQYETSRGNLQLTLSV